jgi:hypothetical protein
MALEGLSQVKIPLALIGNLGGAVSTVSTLDASKSKTVQFTFVQQLFCSLYPPLNHPVVFSTSMPGEPRK